MCEKEAKPKQDNIRQNYQVCFECGAVPLQRASDGAWANYCHKCGKAMPAYLLALAQGKLGIECCWCGEMITHNDQHSAAAERRLLTEHGLQCPQRPRAEHDVAVIVAELEQIIDRLRSNARDGQTALNSRRKLCTLTEADVEAGVADDICIVCAHVYESDGCPIRAEVDSRADTEGNDCE
jgi:ribosomal protein L37AE/L43A